MSAASSSMLSDSTKDDDDVKIIMEQTLLKAEEIFVYRIPPMMTSGGHQ